MIQAQVAMFLVEWTPAVQLSPETRERLQVLCIVIKTMDCYECVFKSLGG